MQCNPHCSRTVNKIKGTFPRHSSQESRDVFDGIGELTGEYTLHTNNVVLPVVHHHINYPYPYRNLLNKNLMPWLMLTLIIAPVSEATKWVSSMAVVKK